MVFVVNDSTNLGAIELRKKAIFDKKEQFEVILIEQIQDFEKIIL